MARLVSYKSKTENSYISFVNDDVTSISNERLYAKDSSTFQLMSQKNYTESSSTSLKMCKKRKCLRFLCGAFGCFLCEAMWHSLCCCNRCRCAWCSNCIDDNPQCDGGGGYGYRDVAKSKYEMSARDNYRIGGGGGGGEAVEGLSLSMSAIDDGGGGNYPAEAMNTNGGGRGHDFKTNSKSKEKKTLEYDEIDGKKSWRKGLKVPKIRITAAFRKEEAQSGAVTTTETCSSPKINEREPIIASTSNVVPAKSPALSPNSGSSDPWPSQSDEDIDRLVALHRTRNSLTSLGVRSDSMASVYSGAGEGRYGTVTVKGQVEFGMQYNYKQGALEIHVVQCRDLAAVDTKRNRSDPYVKVYLLPDKSKGGKRKTKVKKHTLNPVFDETLKFHMSLSSLESRNLWLTVWHSDMFGRNDFLGEVTIPLQGKVFDNPQPQWHTLQERSEPFDDQPTYKGDIIVGLKFIPPESALQHSSGTSLRKFSTKSLTNSTRNSKGALHVLVKEAKHLTPVKANGYCDAFCKSYLLPDKTRSSKQKTPVIKKSTSPVWNYTFIYEDISLSELSERALELTLWDHDRLSSNEFLGGVRFSIGTGKSNKKPADWMDSTGKELSLWQSMINRPNFWVEGCLPLRSSLDNTRITAS